MSSPGVGTHGRGVTSGRALGDVGGAGGDPPAVGAAVVRPVRAEGEGAGRGRARAQRRSTICGGKQSQVQFMGCDESGFIRARALTALAGRAQDKTHLKEPYTQCIQSNEDPNLGPLVFLGPGQLTRPPCWLPLYTGTVRIKKSATVDNCVGLFAITHCKGNTITHFTS